MATEHLKCVSFKLSWARNTKNKETWAFPTSRSPYCHSKRVGRRVRINRHANKHNT